MSVKNKVFVTGASGKIGIKLIKALIKSDFEVIALVRDKNKIFVKSKKIRVIEADILEKEKYINDLTACNYVFHLAAYQNVFDKNIEEFNRVNVEGTKLLLDILAKSKVKKFIYVSTIMVLEFQDNNNFYVKTKKEATRMVEKSTLPWIILYPRIVIDKEWKPDSFWMSILTGGIQGGLNMRFGSKERLIKFIWIDDLINKMIEVMKIGTIKTKMVLEGEEMKANEYLRLMHHIKNKVFIPWRLPFINTEK